MGKSEIYFYEEENGQSSVFDFFEKLRDKAASNKQARTLLDNFYRRLDSLRINGATEGLPHFDTIKNSKYPLKEIRMKHTVGYYRILFCPWNGNSYVLLHLILKKTDKTPPRDIKRAERLMDDWLKRNGGKV